MIDTIHITSRLAIDELIANGFTVKVDYEMDNRHTPHSCLGSIMKDNKSIPFFDTNEDDSCITEIGLIGHDWTELLEEIKKVIPFNYEETWSREYNEQFKDK